MGFKLKTIFAIILGLLLVFSFWYFFQEPPTEGDWQTQLEHPSTAEFNANFVTVKNVRNFRYGPEEESMNPGYYDKTYDLDQIKQVWFVSEPFDDKQRFAHTFLSFEFENGDFLAISIEARKTKAQKYNILKGFLRTYPLMYIASDERDVVMLRANLRKHNVYVYPVNLGKEENKKALLVDMLERMNELVGEKPRWYNSYSANCTSSIAKHVNKIDPGRLSMLSWQLLATGYSDDLAIKKGLIKTDLPIEEARKKYLITNKSIEVGDTPNYSSLIREFK